MADQDQTTQVDVKYVIEAQKAMLADKDNSIIMLTALVNQQQALLTQLQKDDTNVNADTTSN